jgi:hypothetical protein
VNSKKDPQSSNLRYTHNQALGISSIPNGHSFCSVQFFSYLSDRHCCYLLELELELDLEPELDNKAASVT